MSKIVVQGREPHEIKAMEEKHKKEAEAKKKTAAPKIKSYYDVKVECLIPTTMIYRVFADDEREAMELFNKMSKEYKAPTQVKPNYSLKKIIKATVYASGSSVIKLVKNYMVR
jgi:transposase